MTFTAIGISRHRIGTDGVGVTTLVGGRGCPLECKYCLNPQCKRKDFGKKYTIPELYEKIKADSLYFAATGGGVTFGGGEPLLQAEFIAEFIRYVKSKGELWRFGLETCLAVPNSALCLVDGLIDEYMVDVKDMNGDIFRAYTGCENRIVKENLAHLSRFADKVTIRLPLIPGYNTEDDLRRSESELRALGYTRFHRFRYITDIKK